MIKSELIKRIASQNPHLYERDIEKVVSAALDEMVEALRRGDRVELRGFGTFSAKLRGARQGRNPRTGAVVEVAKKTIPAFKAGKELRERLNPEETAPSDNPETLPSDWRANYQSRSNKHRRRSHHQFHPTPWAHISFAARHRAAINFMPVEERVYFVRDPTAVTIA